MSALLFEPGVESPDTRALPVIPAAPRDYLSFSSLRQYQTCPLRYYFRYIAGIPEETVSTALVFGNAIHRAIELHFRRLLESSDAATQDELLREYHSAWQEQALPVNFSKDERADSFDDLAQRMLTAFAQSDLAKPVGHILAVEETLRGQLIPGLPDLLGKVDLILETPTELLVTDWKTSRAKYSPEQVDESAAQLLLYGELAKDLAPGKKLCLQFCVLTKTKAVSIDAHSFEFNQPQVDRTKRIVERIWTAIQAGHFYPAPSPMNCSGCPYRERCRQWPG